MSDYIFDESIGDVLDEIRFGDWEYEWEIYEGDYNDEEVPVGYCDC